MDTISNESLGDASVQKERFERVKLLLETSAVRQVCEAYRDDQLKRLEGLGLNIFTIVSGRYYQENFHSDILAAFLDREKPHGGGTAYFRRFIEFLKTCPGCPADLPDADAFGEYETGREQGRIDVSIRGKAINSSRPKAIIIENKINNAVDQPNQLPRYYADLSKDFDVAAVVYLSLCGDKAPDMANWSGEDKDIKDIIGNKLVRVAAFTKDKTPNLRTGTKDETPNLRTGWIKPCVADAANMDAMDAMVILRQYGKLLQYLGADVMNNKVMEDFWQLMQRDDNHDVALAVRDMLEKVPAYLALETMKMYSSPECNPFKETRAWPPESPRMAVFDGLKFDGASISADLEFGKATETLATTEVLTVKATLNIFDRDKWEKQPNDAVRIVQALLQKAGLAAQFEEFKYGSGMRHRLKQIFGLPSEEDKLHSFLKGTFLPRLKEALSAPDRCSRHG